MEKGVKKIIGRREKINLPKWNIFHINGKVDTGAYNCAIHASFTEEKNENGKNTLEFVLLGPSHPSYTGKKINTNQYKMKRVKNSSGQMETRYLVKTTISIFGEEIEAGFTLSNRSNMKNAILIGRKVLKVRYLVDVDKINLTQIANKNETSNK